MLVPSPMLHPDQCLPGWLPFLVLTQVITCAGLNPRIQNVAIGCSIATIKTGGLCPGPGRVPTYTPNIFFNIIMFLNNNIRIWISARRRKSRLCTQELQIVPLPPCIRALYTRAQLQLVGRYCAQPAQSSAAARWRAPSDACYAWACTAHMRAQTSIGACTPRRLVVRHACEGDTSHHFMLPLGPVLFFICACCKHGDIFRITAV